MKVASLFAGIGGFDFALTRLGHEIVYVNEWDKYAAQIYEKNFGHKPDTRDITAVGTDEIPNHDILVGGFPCQAFSIAGKRRGFNETRGTLFFDIARILKDKKPRYFILENVKGLLSHDNGNTFKTIIATLDELGYDLQWQVLNSKNFGVPQNRERVFIVGHLRGTSRPQVFPIGSDDQIFDRENKPNQGWSQAEVSHTLKGSNNKADNVYITESPVAPTIRATQHKSGDNQTVVYDMSYPSRVREYTENAPTVRDYGSGGNKMPIVNRIRRLTPVECERLQGFPDNWTAGVSDTQRYKVLGNAVSVPVVYEVAKRLTYQADMEVQK